MFVTVMPMPTPAVPPTLSFASSGTGTPDAVAGEFAALLDMQNGDIAAQATVGKGENSEPALSQPEDEAEALTEALTPPVVPMPFVPPAGQFGIARLDAASLASGQPVQSSPPVPATPRDPAPVSNTQAAPAANVRPYPELQLRNQMMPLPQSLPPRRDHAIPAGVKAAPPDATVPPAAELSPVAPDAGAARMPVAELAAKMAAMVQDTVATAEVPLPPEPAAAGPGFGAPTMPASSPIPGLSAVQPPPPAAPLPVLAIDAAMAERLATEIGRGTDAPLKFRLTPERLGPLEITLGQRADGSQLLRIVTATAAAGDAMLAHSSALADAVQRHVGAPVQVAVERAPEQQDRAQSARGELPAGHAGQQGQSAAYSQGQASQHGKSSSPANLWRGRAVNQTEAPSTITPGDAAGRATHSRARYA